MKARITTILSLTGVLVAGSAAAMVNTQVLQPSTTQPPGAETVVNLTAPVGASSVPQQPFSAQPATEAVYQISTAGAVTLDTSGDVLTVIATVPNPGWSVTRVTTTGTNVAVVFQQGTTLVEFDASFVQGVVSTNVVASQVVTTAPTEAAEPGEPAEPAGAGDDANEESAPPTTVGHNASGTTSTSTTSTTTTTTTTATTTTVHHSSDDSEHDDD
jgi:hypothetical protein